MKTKTQELDIVAPAKPEDQIEPGSGLNYRRLLIPKEYVLAFKRVLGKGIEVHSVLGKRVLVSEIKPWTELDERNNRLMQAGAPTLEAPKGHYVNDTYVKTAEAPACTGFIVSVGDQVQHPLVREGGCVAFGNYAGTAFAVSQEAFRILDLSEILFVLRSVEGETMDSVHIPTREDEVIGPVKA
jgi:co-chaperonin GroES (HSP10)